MKKVLKVLALSLVIVACGSKEDKKEKETVKYPKKTSLKQTDPKLKASIERGKLVYGDMCITCHMADGKGVTKAFPPLANSDYLRANQTASITAVKKGLSGEIVVNGVTYNSIMAPLGLSDEEVADVMNYINNSWGNTIDNFVTPEEVSKL